MKALIILFVVISFSAFADDNKSLLKYHFKRDTISSDVPKGKCLIVGKVKSRGNPLADGIVSTIKHRYSGTTDAEGNYRLLIPSQEVELYFFKPYYGEIVTHKYKFKSGHKVELDFFAYEDLRMIEVDKPVVYLYSDTEVDVSVQLIPKGELNFTYPEYKNGWDFTVNNTGLKFEEGIVKTYPYLFWEGVQKGLYFQDNQGEIYGEIIKKSNVVSFLEKELANLGLNEIESTDFITFWGPRMTQYEDVLVQFVVDEDYSKLVSKMDVTPKPDAIRRVYMLFSEIEDAENYIISPPKEISEFVRNGLTLLEWGGSQVSISPELTENK